MDYCCDKGQYIDGYSMDEGRPTFCPLIEIPAPHGRLIDADKLYSVIERHYHVFDGATNTNDIARRDEDLQVMSDIVNAQPVIEAEGE